MSKIRRGSSPRMRGAHVQAFDVALVRGIIPADAGSTRQSPACRAPSRDHPRGCGEHASRSWAILVARGSSPRMRGARAL